MKYTEQIFFEQNDEVFNYFLDNYFYKNFKKEENFHGFELIFSPECDLACKYCYLNKYYDELYTNFDEDVVMKNFKLFLNWYEKNGFICSIDIFSGELFSTNFGVNVLETLVDFFVDKEKKPREVVIPTNYTFILDDNKTARIEAALDKAKANDLKLYLSASVDGKYMEQNRPSKLKISRDDAYYDKVFAFNKKYNFLFHPMIYADGIENWKKNFDWYQEMFKKHGISSDAVFLLQVRNDNWTHKTARELYDFVLYVFDFYFKENDCDSKKFLDSILNDKSSNIFKNGVCINEQGLSCGIQHRLPIRLSDMKMFPCHRLFYPELEIGNFDEDFNFHTKNAELGLAVYSQNNDNWPVCSNCPISPLCMKGCMGAQFEKYGDMFIPIKSVCLQFFYYYKALVDGFEKTGIADLILEKLPIFKNAFKFLKELEIWQPQEKKFR